MKKVILAALLFFAIKPGIQAQSVHVGGKAGANLTKIPGMEFKEGYHLGYHLGVFAEIDFNENWGIQPEVLFNQTNTEFSDDFDDVYQNIPLNPFGAEKVKLNYLSIPVLLRVNVGNLLTLHAGPQFSILTSEDQSLIEEGTNAFKKGDISGVAGAQLNFNSLKVYGRYNFGLSDINDLSDGNKWKSNQIQLGVGFRIL